MAAVAFRFAAVIGEFAGIGEMSLADRNLHIIPVTVTLLASWLMTHTTFAFRYTHEYYRVARDSDRINGGMEFLQE